MDPFTFFVIMTVVSAVVSYLTAPKIKPPKQQGAAPAGISDFSIPTAQEGRAIPIVWGTRFIEGSN